MDVPDIVDVTEKYLQKMIEMKSLNLKVASRTLLFAAILCRMQSNVLAGLTIDEFKDEEPEVIYDEDGFTGKYDSIIEAKAAMGITVNIIFDSSNNEIDNMKLYIFRTGDYYLGYSDLGGYDFWQPILYTDFENDFSYIYN